MRFKRLMCSLLTFSFITTSLLASPIQLTLQGQNLSLLDTPLFINNSIYIPLRSFSDALGYQTTYNKKNNQVIISNDTAPLLTIPIVSTPQIFGAILKDNKTYLPLRMISEGLGYDVKWDGKSQTVSLTKITTIKQNDIKQMALDITECIKNKDYAPITALFDTQLTQALNITDLETSFNALETVLGPIQSYSLLTTGEFDQYKEVDVLLQYPQTTISLAIVFNEEGYISGLHTNQYTPELNLPKDAVEKEITFGDSSAYPLSGTLTLPRATGNYPVVILVHGSGPLDRDETVYNTKFFRDLAYTFAEKGIATFRYDKRTYAYAEELANSTTLTLDEEVIDDVLAAIDLMGTTEGINTNEIYVLGHSLGAMLVPMINEKTTNVAGYIMASAPARPLPDVILEQYEYLTAIDTTMTEEEKAQTLAQVTYFVEAAKNVTPSTAGDTLGLAGFNDLFWSSLNTYDQGAAAQKITVPTLVTQGERDYQVTMTDFNLWKSTLKDCDNFTLKSYPQLNHLYVSGTKESTPDEYLFDSFSDEAYLVDVADWILAQENK